LATAADGVVSAGMGLDLTGTGVWSPGLRLLPDRGAAADAAAELEALGYSALWMPGAGADTVFNAASDLLRATSTLTVATGIISIWDADPEWVAAERAELHDAYDGRFLLGIGVSHAPLVDRSEPGRYKRPLAAMRAYLDSLDAAAPPVLPEQRALAALGPKMLARAAERSLGTHPYLVTPEHTRIAREAVGPSKLVAPELGVVLERDAGRAREIARGFLTTYLGLPNYTNNLLRLGFEEEDFPDGGSDRLVDALIAWGSEDTIAARVAEHRDAGADQVLLQVLTGEDRLAALPLPQWRALAPLLT
jgi:probable F420-dependent oxidoreductase